MMLAAAIVAGGLVMWGVVADLIRSHHRRQILKLFEQDIKERIR